MSAPDGSAGARDRILRRIREALADREVEPHPGAMPRPADEPDPDPAAAFARAFRAAGGEVVRLADRAAAAGWLAGFAAEHGSAAVGLDVPDALRPGLPEAPPSGADLGVSVAAGAGADTGTLLMDSREGREVQLLPPTHLVWLDAADIRATLADAVDEAAERGLPAVLALHSGPSKSADIGRIVVTGVHGPGRVVVGLVGTGPDETEPGEGA